MHVMKLGIVVLAVTAACEQKSPKDDQHALPKTDEQKAEPVQPSPDPSPAARKAAQPSGSAAAPGEDVRKPVAADLAEYTKDIPGTGTKLTMTMETSLGTL